MPKQTPYPRLRVHVRKGRAGQVWANYYYDMRPVGGKDVSLGSDYAEALRRWDELHNQRPKIVGTLQEAFNGWREAILPTYKSAETRKGYGRSLKVIEPLFGPATWDRVTPKVITGYLAKRTAKTQGNREMALLSVIWAWAVREELVFKPFPLLGNRGWKNQEQARTVTVTDRVFDAVYKDASSMLRAAMDIASSTGLRLTDVRTVLLPTAGMLHIKASKTGKSASYEVASSPALKKVLSARTQIVASHLMLLSTPTGHSVSARMLREGFEQARTAAASRVENVEIAEQIKALYLRDMRKRAAGLADSMEEASKLLQHGSTAITAKHYRAPDKLRPVR